MLRPRSQNLKDHKYPRHPWTLHRSKQLLRLLELILILRFRPTRQLLQLHLLCRKLRLRTQPPLISRIDEFVLSGNRTLLERFPRIYSVQPHATIGKALDVYAGKVADICPAEV